jgi:hypothetical protein
MSKASYSGEAGAEFQRKSRLLGWEERAEEQKKSPTPKRSGVVDLRSWSVHAVGTVRAWPSAA